MFNSFGPKEGTEETTEGQETAAEGVAENANTEAGAEDLVD